MQRTPAQAAFGALYDLLADCRKKRLTHLQTIAAVQNRAAWYYRCRQANLADGLLAAVNTNSIFCDTFYSYAMELLYQEIGK